MTDDAKAIWSAFWARTGLDPDELAATLKVEKVWVPREPILVKVEGRREQQAQRNAGSEIEAQIVVGEPAEVIFTLLGTGAVELVEWSGWWRGPHRFVPHRLREHARVIVDPANHLADLVTEFKRQRQERRRAFRRCRYCFRRTPPEHYLSRNWCCHSCGSRHRGIKF